MKRQPLTRSPFVFLPRSGHGQVDRGPQAARPQPEAPWMPFQVFRLITEHAQNRLYKGHGLAVWRKVTLSPHPCLSTSDVIFTTVLWGKRRARSIAHA